MRPSSGGLQGIVGHLVGRTLADISGDNFT
jgi:hypothetical protein